MAEELTLVLTTEKSIPSIDGGEKKVQPFPPFPLDGKIFLMLVKGKPEVLSFQKRQIDCHRGQ